MPFGGVLRHVQIRGGGRRTNSGAVLARGIDSPGLGASAAATPNSEWPIEPSRNLARFAVHFFVVDKIIFTIMPLKPQAQALD